MADQTVADLGKLVKTKHPEYSDMDDAELGLKVKAKYPGAYDDFGSVINTPKISDKEAKFNKDAADFLERVKDPTAALESIPVIGGAIRAGKGIYSAITGKEPYSGGAPVSPYTAGSRVIEGGMDAASPLGLEFAAQHPIRAALAMGAGSAANAGVNSGMQAVGVRPDIAQFGGDVGGVLAGGAAGLPLDRMGSAFMKSPRMTMPDTPSNPEGSSPPPSIASDLGIRVLGLKVPGAHLAMNAIPKGRNLNLGSRIGAAADAMMPQSAPLPRTPMWEGLEPAPENVPAFVGPMPPPVLASGKLPGPAVILPKPTLPPRVSLADQWGTQPTPSTVPDATPIPGQLPSGRTVGGIQNQMPNTTAEDLSAVHEGVENTPIPGQPRLPVQITPKDLANANPAANPSTVPPPVNLGKRGEITNKMVSDYEANADLKDKQMFKWVQNNPELAPKSIQEGRPQDLTDQEFIDMQKNKDLGYRPKSPSDPSFQIRKQQFIDMLLNGGQ